jgi:DNA (cytosine-5)-methyltransferase 1
VDNPNQLACLSLCTGYGGIELGLERVGVPLRPIAYVEREAFAAANLVAKIEAEQMAPAPVWTDVKTFPYSDFHGRVDILLAGYPCQPFSAAGQRKGKADERHLWPFIARGIAACQPRLVFAENVEGHLSLGIKDVFNDLGRMGYEYTAGLFSAEECGASHRRKRLFWLAVDNSCREGLEGLKWDGKNPQRWPEQIRPVAAPGFCQYEWEEPRTVGDTGGTEPNRIPDKEWPSVSEVGESSKRQTKSQLGRTTDGTGCRPDATANRVDRLRLLGNGVVPQTAAKAWVTLWERLNN